MADESYHLKFDGKATASVDAYAEYRRIVGDDDGGKLFSPEEYEAYKKKVIPQRMANRLFVSWSAPSGMDCKMIGPETACFCTHRYKQHKTDFAELPSERPIRLPCKVRGCRCATYNYVPLNGSQPIRCRCKHFADDHKVTLPYKCQKDGCKTCNGFSSSFTCGCGEPVSNHQMIVETKDERLARGHPIGQDNPYQAMGGVTGFSSLMDGYMRLDPSGRGAPSQEFFDQPITSSDHPFLRGNVDSIRAHKMAAAGGNPALMADAEADLAERMSAMRRPGETDMDFFERRYQERQKAERAAARAKPLTGPGRTGTRAAIQGTGVTSTGKTRKPTGRGRGTKK